MIIADANEMRIQLEQLVNAVLKSSKYRNVCEDLIEHIGMRELSKGKSLKAAVKATKNKLHQVGGAYFLKKPKYDVWLERLNEAKKAKSESAFRMVCMEVMGYHYSTKERLTILDEFYSRIFSLLPPVHSVIDVACGFNPISIPWMPLSADAKYYAYDIYKDMISFINNFMTACNVQGYAEARDVTQKMPEIAADLAFVLNTIPCFEQIEKSSGEKVLKSLNSKFMVVSFPVKSLCGREKNMRKHYEAMFDRLVREKEWSVQRLEFGSELVFVIRKR